MIAGNVVGRTGPSAEHRGEVERALDEVRTRLLVGAPLPASRTRLPGRATRALQLASAVGAPGVPALDAAVAAFDDGNRRERALGVATAQARAVAMGLSALPPLAVFGLGSLLDEPLWRFYLTPSGAIVGAVGLALAATGAAGALGLVRRARRATAPLPPLAAAALTAIPVALLASPLVGLLAAVTMAVVRRMRRLEPPPTPEADEIADLTATAMCGGLPPAGALRAVAEVLPAHATELRRGALSLELLAAVELPPGLDRVGRVLTDVTRWGAPAEPALRRIAADLRAAELQRALAAAERLPALLAFPTALCLLPACLLLVGAPLLAEGLAAASGGIS
ncbi:MAG: hypothetical protein ABR592_04920 [Nitriliruptorales bacterium]